MTDKQDVWYRYEDQRWSVTIDAEMEIYGTRLEVVERQYYVIRRTPKGAWLRDKVGSWGPSGDERWVGLGQGKRFAYPTRKEALEGYIARKNRQIKIYSTRLGQARDFLKMAEEKLSDVIEAAYQAQVDSLAL